VAVTVPIQYAAKAYGAIKGFGTIKREEWRADGSWSGVLEMPAGLYAPLLEKLGDVTKGNGEAKIIS
jgi:ribosome maturation protein SDO1